MKPHYKPKNVKLTNNLTLTLCRRQNVNGVIDIALREGRLAPDAMQVSLAALARIRGY